MCSSGMKLTPATWALRVSPSIRKSKCFQQTIPQLSCWCASPFSNRRPIALFLIRHCCEKLLFASYASKKLEHLFVIQIRTILRFKLIWNLANLQQKRRPDPNPSLQSNNTILCVGFRVLHVTCEYCQSFGTSFVPHDDQSWHHVDGPKQLWSFGHVQLCQRNRCPIGTNSRTLLKSSWEQVMSIHASRFQQL